MADLTAREKKKDKETLKLPSTQTASMAQTQSRDPLKHCHQKERKQALAVAEVEKQMPTALNHDIEHISTGAT